MLLVFVDEMGDARITNYFGFCIATMNARFYPSFKKKTQDILSTAGWNPHIEFKGSHLFSASTGCLDVGIEQRIETANQLLSLNVSESNSRMQFHYGRMQSENHSRDYLIHLPALLEKCLPRAPSGAGKNLLILVCDQRSDITATRLQVALGPVTRDKGWVLLEHVVKAESSFDTVGLMFADLVGYLAARIDTISKDYQLFEGLTPEQLRRDGRLKKLRSSTELIRKIKRLNVYTHPTWGN